MRGAHAVAQIVILAIGIIPADAGSTHQSGYRLSTRADHPRGCGEHGIKAADRRFEGGSSPRMRGARISVGMGRIDTGIIPADAGSTAQGRVLGAGPADHPRGCGEHLSCRPAIGRHQGSSPRMRGALCEDFTGDRSRRIIPADAGSTDRSDSQHPTRMDHPRGCGEHLLVLFSLLPATGSSPRMRGALLCI